MKLYLITNAEPHNPEALQYMLNAAQHRQLEMSRINVEQYDLRKLAEIETSSQDIVYREANGLKSRTIEGLFLCRPEANRPTAHYLPTNDVGPLEFEWRTTHKMAAYGLPVIPSIFLDDTWHGASEAYVDAAVESLGGYPVILKRSGLSHGQGVSLLNSAAEILDVVRACAGKELFSLALRQYIPHYRHARLVVVGEEVVDSIEYIKPDDDFRTNATANISVIPMGFDEAVERLAVQAARLRGTAFGGADILIDKDTGKHYLAELNVPCNFARNQDVTGVDNAGLLLDYLMAKAAKAQA